MELERAIADLLYQHDCVIVPGLGGFIAERSSAKQGRVFHPPSKAIVFNEALQSQDGLLTDYLARREQIAFEEAAQRIAGQVQRWRETLSEGRYVRLSGIGKLSLGAEESIQFEPSQTVNYLRASFGLPSVYAEALPQAREKKSHPWRGRMKYAALWFSALALSTFSLYPVSDQPAAAERDRATLNPFASVSTSAPVPSPAVKPPTKPAPRRTALPEHSLSDKPSKGLKQLVNEGRTSSKRTAVALTHQLIAGAFRVRANAKRLVRRLKRRGYDAQLAGKAGRLTLVSVGRFASKAAALRAYYPLRKTLPKIWYHYAN